MPTAALISAYVVLLFSLKADGEDPVGVRLLGEESSQGKGELQLLDFGIWTPLCGGSMGAIEGQLACHELGFPLLQQIGAIDGSAGYFGIAYLVCGAELALRNVSSLPITECNYEYGQCVSTVYLECSNSTAMGTVIVGVETNYTEMITFVSVVSPDDNLYVDTCFTKEPLDCSGIFHFQKAQPVIRDLVTQLGNNASCGFIDFDPCVELPTDTASVPTEMCTNSDVTCSANPLENLLGASAWVVSTLLVMAVSM